MQTSLLVAAVRQRHHELVPPQALTRDLMWMGCDSTAAVQYISAPSQAGIVISAVSRFLL